MRGRHQAQIDCVVVGAGPAGLACSAALTVRGVDHIVLERAQVGQSWRTQRWDSFRLNNPGWLNPMLGDQPRDTYLTGAEVVERLDTLAAPCPICANVPVTRLSPDGIRWALQTGHGLVLARTVVVATGGENVARTPASARVIPRRIRQYHAADYCNPSGLPDGTVLVVGSAQSGTQIAEDLLSAGRRVILSTSPVGRAPARHRGRDTLELLVESGFFSQRPGDLPDPSVMSAPQPLIAPAGRGISLQTLARAGVTLTGRLVSVDGEQVSFDSSACANIAAADAFAARIRVLLDEVIRRTGGPLPPIEPDPADLAVQIHPPSTLNLRAEGVSAVVWGTGFTGDFSWLDPRLLDDRGWPRHEDAAAPSPGVWYAGLRWLTHRASGNFLGFPTDAATTADAVVRHLAG